MDEFDRKRRELESKRNDSENGWLRIAQCLGQTDIFFGENGAGWKKAVDICFTCDARIDCLEYALFNNIDHGIAGGRTERERIKLKRQYKMHGVVALISADKIAVENRAFAKGLQPQIKKSELQEPTQISVIEPKPFSPYGLPTNYEQTS